MGSHQALNEKQHIKAWPETVLYTLVDQLDYRMEICLLRGKSELICGDADDSFSNR